jgi:hypothetical protein
MAAERQQSTGTSPGGYPAVHHLTRGLCTAAGAGGADRLHLWAVQGSGG